MKTISFKKEALAKKDSTLKKKLPVVIVAAIVILCTASTVSAYVIMDVWPDRHVTCPQTSLGLELDDKTVTYTITVETNSPTVYVEISPEETPISWFSWPSLSRTLSGPGTITLDLTVPLTLGKDVGDEYTFTITARGIYGGSSGPYLLYLDVQDQDYVSETRVTMEPENHATFTLDERLRSKATSVDKLIVFNGTVDRFEKNEYLILKAQANNPDFQQESYIVDFVGPYMTATETFKSCAPLGGTGVTLSESYNVHWMGQRLESLGHYITGDQRYKTELSTYNEFDGNFTLNAKQIVPSREPSRSRYVREHQTFDGNLTVDMHRIYRLPP